MNIYIDVSKQLEAQWAEPVSLTFRSALRKLNAEPSIVVYHQVLGYLTKQFQRRRLLEIDPIRNKNCLWHPCLFTGRDEISNLCWGPSIDASYQVLVHLAKGFQRRRLKCEKLTDNGRQVMAKVHIAFWQGELKSMDINKIHRN